jgi:predicted metal-dependent hydrolase
MTSRIEVGEIVIELTLKNVKHVHLSVHPPDGRVTLIAPSKTRTEVARAYAVSKLAWIRAQRAVLKAQAREERRTFVTRESHYLWGKRYLLVVIEREEKPRVVLDHRRITLQVRPGSSRAKRAEVMQAWHRSLLHQAVPRLIARWEPRMGLKVERYFLQRMKTKWGACNHRTGTIRINTELARKPKDLLEYVVVHEMLHLIESTHSERFVGLLTEYYPTWREARAELNYLPLAAESWAGSRRIAE